MIFPEVKELKQTGVFSFGSDVSVAVSLCDGFSRDTVKTVFGSSAEYGNLILSCKKDIVDGIDNEEAYKLVLAENDGVLTVNIKSFTEKGFIRALFTVKRMLIKNEFVLGEITDYPSFSVRGYIEGFYGNPWKSEERLEMMELMALFGENTHYYAPKDDPYHRNKWRELYPQKEASELKKLVDKANSLYMDFYYCIAPGLSMQYSSDEDYKALCDKTVQLYSMGIKNFGLLLDDIPADLFYEEDKRIFSDAVNAHVILVKKYFEFLKSLSEDTKLTVCPTAYHGKGTEKELVGFAGNVPDEVSVFFTGSDICSKELTEREAMVFIENTGHKPLYWDNYPVNDAEMFMEMHIGPVIGREKNLHKYSDGLISNCMEYFNCNKIPLITVAAYLWNSEKYEPETAFNEAVSFMLDGDEKEDFILLCDHFRTSCLKDENSRIMGECLSKVSVYFQTGEYENALKTVEEYSQKVSRAAGRLKKRTAPVYKELSRWIKKFCLMSDILELSLKVLKGEAAKTELEELMAQYNESATVLTSFCFREYIESVLEL